MAFADPLHPVQRHLKRFEALRAERSSWEGQWREIADYIAPGTGRFIPSDRNDGQKKNSKIINNTAGKARRTLAAGMMAGITSPARPWFRLTTPDPDLAEIASVRTWLHRVEQIIRNTFLKSNIYECFYRMYLALPYGTAVFNVETSVKTLIRGYSFPIGQFCLAQNDELRVDTIYREMSKTVSQLVRRYGYERCSPAVQNLWDRGEYDKWIEILHAITPNDEQVIGRADEKGMPFTSSWMEKSGAQGFLRVKGFHEFPAMVARWDPEDVDIYARGPGHEALGDTKALQTYERRAAQMVDKITTPPMKGPPGLRRSSLLPGDYTPVPGGAAAQSYEPAYRIDPAAVTVTREKILEHEQRIKAEFYADLFLMLAEADGNMTATEVMERHEEKMLQLGPVLTKLESDVFNPLIDRTYGILERAGDLPPPPEELADVDLKVEFISIMSEAQKLGDSRSVERFTKFVTDLAATSGDKDPIDKLNRDEVVEKMGDYLNIPPELVNSDDKVQQLRKARSAQAQAEQQQQQALAATQAAKNMGGASTQPGNALGDLLNSIPGAAAGALQTPGVTGV